MEFNAHSALSTAAASKGYRDHATRDDRRHRHGVLWPHVTPRFQLEPGATIFTIGSCFARNIEEALLPRGFKIPTRSLVTPPVERGQMRPNAVLNEFNPGTMCQRVLHALDGRAFPDDTIVESGALAADLLILCGSDVTRARAIERRGEIASVYANLETSACVVMTLGLIEAWFDKATGLYLNRMPPVSLMKAHPSRYTFRRLEFYECLKLIDQAVAALVSRGIKVILTVSPVPMHTTFTGADCVVANELSKSMLRLCVERTCATHGLVDYFPSYEIVRSGGLASYESDHVHVRNELVHEITQYMVSRYCPDEASGAGASAA